VIEKLVAEHDETAIARMSPEERTDLLRQRLAIFGPSDEELARIERDLSQHLRDNAPRASRRRRGGNPMYK
jgi:hypothetical protein